MECTQLDMAMNCLKLQGTVIYQQYRIDLWVRNADGYDFTCYLWSFLQGHDNKAYPKGLHMVYGVDITDERGCNKVELSTKNLRDLITGVESLLQWL